MLQSSLSFAESVHESLSSEPQSESEVDIPLPLSLGAQQQSLPPATSFRDCVCESQEMRRLLSLHDPPDKIPPGLQNVSYASSQVFPDWILSNATWKNGPKNVDNHNEISDILKIPVSKRQPEQVSTLIHWLMSVWGIANTMGFKRCNAMFKEFKYQTFEEGEAVIKEGDRGLTFYIIISGMTSVSKEGIGVVGQLGKGKSFGEIALTQGKDLRTATVTAISQLEVLSLHKMDYDYFVRDIQETERRENFTILSSCRLFKSWPKGKIDKICNTCLRKTFEVGSYIFKQGDAPDDLLVVVEGNVNIVKELVILCKNRWPVAPHKWKQLVTTSTKPIMLKTLQKGDYFGEVAILKNTPRTTSAVAASRCVLISLDKNEFLHLVTSGSGVNILEDQEGEMTKAIQKYVVDEDLVAAIGEIKGGPNSAALLGGFSLSKSEVDQRRRNFGLSVSASPKYSTGHRSPTKKISPAKSDKDKDKAKRITLQDKLQAAKKQESVNEQLQRMVEEKRVFEERIREQAEAVVGDRRKTMFKTFSQQSLPSAWDVPDGLSGSGKLPPPLGAGTGTASESRLRSRLEGLRNGTLLYGSSSSMQRRTQHQPLRALGEQSDALNSKQMLLRRNSAISLSHFYDHVKEQLESSEENAATAAEVSPGSPLRRSSLAQPSPALLEIFRTKHKKDRENSLRRQQTITEFDNDEDDV